jgi:hypothetical protein
MTKGSHVSDDSKKAHASFSDLLSWKGSFKKLVDLSFKHAFGLSLITWKIANVQPLVTSVTRPVFLRRRLDVQAIGQSLPPCSPYPPRRRLGAKAVVWCTCSPRRLKNTGPGLTCNCTTQWYEAFPQKRKTHNSTLFKDGRHFQLVTLTRSIVSSH